MNSTQKGFIFPLLIIVTAVVVIGGFYIYYQQHAEPSMIVGDDIKATSTADTFYTTISTSTLQNISSGGITFRGGHYLSSTTQCNGADQCPANKKYYIGLDTDVGVIDDVNGDGIKDALVGIRDGYVDDGYEDTEDDIQQIDYDGVDSEMLALVELVGGQPQVVDQVSQDSSSPWRQWTGIHNISYKDRKIIADVNTRTSAGRQRMVYTFEIRNNKFQFISIRPYGSTKESKNLIIPTPAAPQILSISIKPSTDDGLWLNYKSGAQAVVSGKNLGAVELNVYPTGSGSRYFCRYGCGLGVMKKTTTNGDIQTWTYTLGSEPAYNEFWAVGYGLDGSIVESKDLGNVSGDFKG